MTVMNTWNNAVQSEVLCPQYRAVNAVIQSEVLCHQYKAEVDCKLIKLISTPAGSCEADVRVCWVNISGQGDSCTLF